MNDSYIIANRTDVGRMRDHNEDNMVTFDSPNGRVIAVCDGMGGQAAGDVASRLACDIITDILCNNTFSTPNEAITRAVMAANQGILHRASLDPELEGMGSTCVIVIIKDEKVYYGWVGDSRIYYIADGTITQISRDQSYVQQLIDAGQLTPEEGEHHPQKNEITNALGVSGMTPPELGAIPIVPAEGSVILLCSDGLSGMVDNDTILSIVSDPDDSIQRKADRLVDAANANGGVDNITVQLVQFRNSDEAGVTGFQPAKSEKKSKMMLYGSIVLGILIVCAALIFAFAGKEESETNRKPEQIQDNRTQQPTKHTVKDQPKTNVNSGSSETKTKSKEVVKESPNPKKKNQEKVVPKSQQNAVEKAIHETPEKGSSEGIKIPPLNPGEQEKANVQNIDEAIENQRP